MFSLFCFIIFCFSSSSSSFWSFLLLLRPLNFGDQTMAGLQRLPVSAIKPDALTARHYVQAPILVRFHLDPEESILRFVCGHRIKPEVWC